MVWLGGLLNKGLFCKKKIFGGTAAYIAGSLDRAGIYRILFEKAPMTETPEVAWL
jgi:hypothetical protein